MPQGVRHILTSRHLPHLTCIDLHGTSISSESLVHITTCEKLSKLVLSYCRNIDDVGLQLIGPLSNLTQISLSGCSITDTGLCHIASHCRGLKHIFLNETSITDIGIIAVADHCNDLCVLSASSVKGAWLRPNSYAHRIVTQSQSR